MTARNLRHRPRERRGLPIEQRLVDRPQRDAEHLDLAIERPLRAGLKGIGERRGRRELGRGHVQLEVGVDVERR